MKRPISDTIIVQKKEQFKSTVVRFSFSIYDIPALIAVL